MIAGGSRVAADGGPTGCWRCTGSPATRTRWRRGPGAAAAGYAVECPRLPGHGTDIADMLGRPREDWVGEAEAALARLRAKVRRRGADRRRRAVDGRALTVDLAHPARRPRRHRLINALAESPGRAARRRRGGGRRRHGGLPRDRLRHRRSRRRETAYEGTPLRPLLTLFDGVDEFQAGLAGITCPVLIMNSPEDHVVPPSNSDHLARPVGGPVERVSSSAATTSPPSTSTRTSSIERILDFAAKVTT